MAKKTDVVEVESSLVEIRGRRLFDRVSDYLTARDWNFSTFEEKQYFSFHLRLRDGMVRVIVEVREDDSWSRLLSYVTYATYVPAHRRQSIADALARINYCNIFGSLDIDMSDGEVRSKAVLESDTILGDEMIDRTLRRSLDLADQYQAPLLAIAFGNAPAGEVLELASRDEEATLQ